MLDLKNCEVCSIEEFKKILQGSNPNYIFIDVRTRGEFKSSSIEGVKNIPLDDLKKHINELKKYEKVYVHCHNGSRSREACKKLSNEGINSVIVEGGIVEWRRKGFPIKSSGDKEPISLERQVQITVGVIILASVILAKFFNPEFIYVSALMGIGLLFTGITGNCMMARFLSIMPWNR